MTKTSAGWVVAALAVGALLGGTLQARAEAPRVSACVTFAAANLAGSGEKAQEQDKPVVVANFQSIGPVAEQWVNKQLAAGKTQFFASTVAVNGSVVCAW